MQEAAIRPASRLETVTSLAGQALRVREVRAIITRLRFAGIAAALGAASLTVSPFYPASVPGSAAGPITTPVSAVRFYQESVNRGLCAQAYKLVALGEPRTSMHPFLTRCAATKYLAVIRIIDPGYRLGRLSAQYTCLGVQLRTYLRNGAVQPSGGWYLMEKTPALFWHILLTRSHIIPGGKAAVPPRAICAGAIPSYARLSSAQLIIGSAFLSGTTAWIAVSRSGAYVPNGSCTHGIGSNCDTADTVIYRTDDAGVHWRRLLSLTTSPGPLVWIRLFTESDGLVAADMGAQGRGMLFRTSDEGRSWSRSPLPAGYSLDPTTITFPDSRHGWVYIGNGAMGSMAVTVFATADGGTRWTQVACTPIPAAPQPCRTKSGIPFSGDKGFISFINSRSGWLSIVPNSGIPALLHSIDGGHSWHDQHVGLPPTVRPSNTVFPMGVFGQPSIFGHVGIMAESVDVYRPRNRTTRSGLYVYRSADAGASWHFEPASSLPTAFVARNDPGQRLTAQVVDAQHWFATDDAVIWWTADGGRSWFHVPMHVPRGLDLVSLTFMDSVHGWAEALPHRQTGGVLGATALLRTRDGGRDWLRIPGGSLTMARHIMRATGAAAFRPWVEPHLWALLGDKAEAEDVTSVVFLRTLDRIGSFCPGRGSFASWLFTIARNAARDRLRKRSRGPVILSLQERDPDPHEQPENTAVEREVRAAMWRAYGALTDEQKDAVSLRYLAGLSFVDVARAMHRSEPATKMLVRRGIEGLRRGLAEEGYDARQ